MKRNMDACEAVGCTKYQQAWKHIVELLRLPAVHADMRVLLYLEQNFHGLVIHCGNDSTLTLRNILGNSPMAQVRACHVWRGLQFPGMSKVDVLKRMDVLRCWLLNHIHGSQRCLAVAPLPSLDTVAACEPMNSLSVLPSVSTEVRTFTAAFLTANRAARTRKAAARCGSPPRDWRIGASPMFGGHASVTVKRMCLNVVDKVKNWLREDKGSKQLAPIMWNPDYFLQAKRNVWSKIKKRATLALCKVKHRWGHLVADMCGVGYTSFTRWRCEYNATGLRSPFNPGPVTLSQEVYQDMFRDLLIWGEAICKSRRAEGRSTRVADMAEIALENEAFKDSVSATLVSVESIVTNESERLLDILQFTDSGKGDKRAVETRNHVLRRLKSLLQHLGFEWRPVLRECINTMTLQVDWTLRFARWYFKFLTEPRTDCFLYWMDESFIYEGEADPGSMVEPAAAQAKHV